MKQLKTEIEKNRIFQLYLGLKRKFNKVDFKHCSLSELSDNIGGKILLRGRIIAIRKKGQIIFTDLLSNNQTIQLLIKNNSSDDIKHTFETYVGKGDIIEFTGIVEHNKRNNIIINVVDFNIVSKSHFILPKILNDKPLKQKYRYIDLVVNADSRKILTNNTVIVKGIRDFLENEGFVNFITPTLSTSYNGGTCTPFTTKIASLKKNGYLRVTSEIYLKQLIAAGWNSVFEIGQQYRNEGLDSLHLPEFLMLEAYKAFVDTEDMLLLVLRLFESISILINGKPVYFMGGKEISCSVKNWRKINIRNAILNEMHVDILDENKLKKNAYSLNIEIADDATSSTIISKLISKYVERNDNYLIIIEGIPHGLTPLMKEQDTNSEFADRFWLFAGGIDFCDIGKEKTDFIRQKDALALQHKQLKERRKGLKINNEITDVLAFGLPPTCGIGLSISRLLMIFSNIKDIRETSNFYFR